MWAKPEQPSDPHRPAANELPAGISSSSIMIKQKNPGRRYAQIIKLKPEHVDEYKAAHAKVWPEVVKQIHGCNIHNYSIFHDPDSSVLFSYFTYVGYDFAGDMQRMRDNPKVREWWKMIDPWQISVNEGATHSAAEEPTPSWWKPVEEVFFLP